MKKYLAALPLALALTACAGSAVKKDINDDAVFGVWQVENCTVYANHHHIHITTDGRLSSDELYLKVSSDLPLARIPSFKITGLEYLNLAGEGFKQHFSVEVPYTPAIVGRMLKDEGMLVVSYRPSGWELPTKAFFPTAGLPHAISYMSRVCNLDAPEKTFIENKWWNR